MSGKIRVKGFKFAGIHAGIKENPNKKDLSIIYSEVPCQIAATYTTNLAKAAPVILDEKKMKKGLCQAIIMNSGNANACTGDLGIKNAQKMIDETAKALNISSDLVFVSSTGKIGVQMPIEKISRGIRKIVSFLDPSSIEEAARGILTTDFFPKIAFVKGKIGKTSYSIAGFAKGAGMIEPAMKGPTSSGQLHATMLGYFLTDLNISAKVLQQIWNKVVDETFNRITVDGDMSTNDTAILLANGLAGNSALRFNSKEAKQFEENLKKVATDLALKMVEDGEGATKVVELNIQGARSEAEAKRIAYKVGRSQLVKTSFFGEDPNWGRLLAAVGYSGEKVNPEKVDIYYGKVKLVSKGLGLQKTAERRAHQVMKAKHFPITIHLNQGKSSYRIWTSDITYDYVKLNAEYRT